MKLQIDEFLLQQIFSQESQVVVGKAMKRFECHSDINEIKKAVKEILYEGFRDIQRLIVMNGKYPIKLEIKK